MRNDICYNCREIEQLERQCDFETERLEQRCLRLFDENKKIKEELSLNVSMLAQQCDMAREAETRQMEAEKCLRKAEELLSEFVHSGVSFEDERIEYVEMQIGKSLIRDAMRWLHERSNQDA